ncbi:MAG: efflux RND transporter periplasmic adaptor subunit [Chloroflexaceae bacterium]|nr:efflux RND transporter periplasmic adaptor subunit [Chloroflexaceae bacterium]
MNEARSTTSDLQEAEAEFREAQEQLNELLAGPRPEAIAQARAQLAGAKAQEQLVLAQLKDTQVLAPVSGKIAQRNARLGDITSSSEQLFTIIEQGRLELRLQIPETELTQIRPGQAVDITSDSDRRLALRGTVREIDPIVTETSRQATVKVNLPAVKSLKPGMFLRGAVTIATTTGLTVPAAAVLPQTNGSIIVYILQPENRVQAQTVTAGEILGDGRIEILSGLSPQDRVVVKGAAFLKNNDKVEILPQ